MHIIQKCSVILHLDTHDAPRQQLACLEWLRMYDAIAASEDECSSVEYLRRLRSILVPVRGLDMHGTVHWVGGQRKISRQDELGIVIVGIIFGTGCILLP